MPANQTIDVYSVNDAETFRVSADELRAIASRELGMVQAPFELTIFTKTILATALQREQILRNEELRKVMTDGGDWKRAMQAVNACTELMEKLGIDDAKWSPTAGGTVTAETAPEAPVAAPDSGQQVGLNLDGQTELPL